MTRVVAFYLPQYHPTPENDRWWGPGFTEWRNVVNARPMFDGHHQPVLPSELGYYDLRVPETRARQAELAKAHGIDAFCYYHYWFGGTRLLGRPLDDVLASGEPHFPFCLCWANENWTRAWDGLDRDVLVAQRHSADDDRRHMRWLSRALLDDRYLRVNGRPLLVVYRVSLLPNPTDTAMTWREEARRLGVGDIFLATVESLRADRVDPTRIGFDAAIEFQPDWLNAGPPLRVLDGASEVYSYDALADGAMTRPRPAYQRFAGVTTGWDNSPRRRRDARIFSGATPAKYEAWLRHALDRERSAERRGDGLVFVNAWNEWAEGAVLEPSERWGRQFLEATLRAVESQGARVSHAASAAPSTAPRSCVDERAPLVSVCIPTWNGARYLAAAIDSVLAQTLGDFELLVVDDASADDTLSVARGFTDARLRVVQNPSRRGLVGNWNRCLELASGRYVCLFHQDDVMMPTNLERKIEMLERHPGVGFVHSNVWQIDGDGGVISRWWYSEPAGGDEGVKAGRDVFDQLLHGVNIVSCPSVVARRSVYEDVGMFDPSLPFTADWEMWMRIALTYDVGYLSEALVHYRRHSDNETHRFSGARELEHAWLAKRRALAAMGRGAGTDGTLRVVQDSMRRKAIQRARECAGAGHRSEAREFVGCALRLTADEPGERDEWVLDVLDELLGAPRSDGDEGDSMRRALDDARHEVAALRNSLSWRLTRPLRSMYDVLLRIRRPR